MNNIQGNLFIVFTPLQLFVAQQIIRQESLENNVIIEGWRNLFAKTYDMMRINELWAERIEWQDISLWDRGRIKGINDIWTTYKNFKRIKNICNRYKISTIYLGEVLNQACRFTAVLFSNLKYEIVFFEEGTSHYINRPYIKKNSLSHRLKIWIYDLLYYLPLYHVRFAEWRLNTNMPYDKLPIDKRFSIIPFHNKAFDTRLYVKPMFSSELMEYVKTNFSNGVNERRYMLMTDPLRELMKKEDLYLYFETIKECVDSIDRSIVLYIKFHPREIESSRKRILEIVHDSGIKFKVLSEEVNICVEYYLQLFSFEKIFFFNAATYFYNGYAFPKTEFVKLMPIVYKKAKEKGIEDLTYMENMLKMIETYQL